MVSRTDFENLRVYRLSEALADEIWDIVLGWDAFARNTVGAQIVRSGDSVGVNIAEGVGRGTYKDNRRFVRNARGSLNETQHWLRRAFRRKLLTSAQIEKLKPLVDSLAPQLSSYLKSSGPVSGLEPAPTSDDEPLTTDH